MRRSEIIQASENVLNAFKQTNLLSQLGSFSRAKDGESYYNLLTAFSEFSHLAKKFTETENYVLEVFGLSALVYPKVWAEILSATEKEKVRDTTFHFRSAISSMLEFLPKFINLLKQENVNYVSSDKAQSIYEGKEILTLILPEEKKEVSKVERVVDAIVSINLFYETICILNDSVKDLAIAALDSGSDKSFDFLGAASFMKEVREIILGLWDRVVFFREKKVSERLDLIAKSLPIIERINEAEGNGKIGKEQGEILRRNIVEGSKKFISVGAIIPELESFSSFSPRQLMAPEPKLLSEPKPIKGTKAKSIKENDEQDFTESIDEEEQQNDEEVEKRLWKKLKEKYKDD